MKDARPGYRLTASTVMALHRAVGGDARTEELVLRFIAHRYNATSLMYLPPKVAAEILRRPADFIRAAKTHFEPELNL